LATHNIVEHIVTKERNMNEFALGHRVKVQEHADTREGEIGIVTAIYDPRYTPARYPQGSEYRVTFNDNRENCGYFKEDELELVVTHKAYGFKKGKELHWFTSQSPRKGFVRSPKHDHEFEE
jgi:hypothetical protein